MKVLVIGGTGPTGPFIVNGLVERGHTVTVLHSGRHEVDSLPPESVVPHIHADPFDAAAFEAALAGERYDAAFVMYGRLRSIAKTLQGQVGHLITIGGIPVYAGFADADEFSLATPRAGRGAAFFLAWRSSILPPAFAMAGGGAVAAGALSRTGARTDCLCGLPWP